ncbi:hypothetical protein NP233_g5658 [Leucocoprinus birnbaumii]|uniref:MYND-type domain-containing protein n=1 Tax=Leucocoprinus birnbaumii TaxID=56174 RepID=A0AAD5YRP0_9AGAR|nr:hypothetical protein NP233_g5658 [Leucocoprinus birnbaumii]
MVIELQAAGTPERTIRQILEEFHTRALSEPRMDDSSSENSDESVWDDDEDDLDTNGQVHNQVEISPGSRLDNFSDDYSSDNSYSDSDYSDDGYDANEALELTRQEMIQALRDLQVRIGPETKLQTSQLESGLRDALRSAQLIGDIKTDIDPDTLPLWKREESIVEAFNLIQRSIPPVEASDARSATAHLVTCLEHAMNEGMRCVTFVDEKEFRALCIRIISIRNFDGKPLVVVAYSTIDGTCRKNLKLRVARLFGTETSHIERVSTRLEQGLLTALLGDNQLKLPYDYEPQDEFHRMYKFMFSFILPLACVSQDDLRWICQRNRCTRCAKSLNPECSPYVFSDAQYCSRLCENKAAQVWLSVTKKEKAGQDPNNLMFLPNGHINPSYELEESYFENGYVDPDEELQRSDIIYILRGMRLDIPPWTKLSTSKLEARLRLALDASQRYSGLLHDAARVELDQFPRWDEKVSSPYEALGLSERIFSTTPQDKREEAMASVCSLLSRFFKCAQKGADTAIFTSAKDFRVFVMKILHVYALQEATPLILTGYKVVHGLAHREDILEEVRLENGPKGIISIPMTSVEQRLLEFYLEQNQDRLLANKTIPESVMLPVNRLSRDGYEFGFILPLRDISPKDVVALNEFGGCKLCGVEAKSRCASCKVVGYCGKVCQVTDWKKHKPFCLAVTSGTWHQIKLAPSPASPRLYTSSPEYSQRPPENLYSDKYHLIKLEHVPNKSKGSKQIMVASDAAKSFTLRFSKTDNGAVFENVMKALNADIDRKAIYRWVKRVGDWEWKICLECVPETLPSW